MITHEKIRHRIDASLAALAGLRDHVATIATVADVIVERLRNGGRLYTCGNGGSAAQAMHLAEELVGRYRSNRKPLAAICLNADPTALTCIANDFGFDQVFSRPCEAFVKPRDVLLVFSTTGNSANLVGALKAARARGAITVGLLGRGGGACAALCDHAVIIETPGGDSAFIQEAHQVILHLFCEMVESAVTG